MKVLQKRRDELLASLPAVDDLATGSADIDLIKGLCNLYREPVYPQDMMDLIRALRQRQKFTKDVVSLLQCLESFALVVTKYHAPAQYAKAVEGWSMHDLRRVSDHHCLHYVLLHLNEDWRGLHVVVVIYLLRAGVRKLQDYFASATRPAAILSLLQGLNDAHMIRRHADRMRHLISKALPSQESRIGQMTPLGMLHKMTTGFMPGPVQPGSQTRSIPPTVVTPAMDRKRGIALVDMPGDGDKPTKRQRVDEHRAEHFGTRASNEGRFVPLETDSSQFSPLDHRGGKVFSSDSHELDSDSSAPPTHGEPTVDTAAESECEDFLNDIVTGDVTPVRYDPAFAATPNTLVSRKLPPFMPAFAVPRTRTNVKSQKRKRDSSDRSELGKRALVKPLLRRRGNEGDVPHEKHPENSARQCNDTVAVGKDDTSKGLRFLHLSTGTASAGSSSDGLTQHHPPVSHAGGALPDQNLSPDQSEVNELESKGEALWTEERGPTAIAGHCGPQSIRKLAARKDDRLNDEIVNTIPIIAVPADNRTYLLPSYAFEHIRKGRFDRLSSWVKSFPSVNCRWVFGVCQQDHWTAVAIDWQEGRIQHYNPLTGLLKQAGDIYTAVECWTQHLIGTSHPTRRWRLEHVHGPRQAADDVRNCGVYVAWVLREWMHGRPGDAEEFRGHLEFRIEMLQLLQGAFRTPGLPSVGDVLGSPSTKDSEGDGPADLAGDQETATGKRDAKSITEDTATTPLSKAQTKNLTSLQLELRERMGSMVQADVDGHREQAERTSGPGEGPHAKNTLSAEERLPPSAPEPATSVEARSCPILTVATSMIPGYHSNDRRPETSQEKFPRVTAPCVEEVAHPHSARPTIVKPGTDVTSLDESEDVKCDQLRHMDDLGFPAAEHNRSYASGYAYQPDCSSLGDAPTQSIPDIGGSALMSGAWDLGDDAGLLPSPGLPLSTHFEDALGE
ncbi:hypothetical protein LTS00_018005, partial [Friedmanniomyces endolithicus]